MGTSRQQLAVGATSLHPSAMEVQLRKDRTAVAFTAPVTTSFTSSLFGRHNLRQCGRITGRARVRSVPVPARIFALGAAPAPPSPDPDADAEAAAAEQPEVPVPEGAAEKEPVANGEEVTADDILNSPSFLKKKLEIVQKELIEVRDAVTKAEDAVKDEKASYVRLVADFENYRRRSAEDMRKLETKSTAKVCKAILEVLDNFDRADAAVTAETEREKSIQGSYAAINKQLVEALVKLKVEPIESVGTPFDPEMHEAIQRQESTEYAENIVSAQYSKGYVIEDSLIRAAVVAVSAGPGPEVDETETKEAEEPAIDVEGEVAGKDSPPAEESAAGEGK